MISKKKDLKIAVIGLGYVGLPLALEFSKKNKVIGFDINAQRIKQLKSGVDKNLDFTSTELKISKQLHFTYDCKKLEHANCFIISVPTPVDQNKNPNLIPLFSASKMIGNILKKDDLVIYESTVYPGCIEEECVPILEKFSKLKFNQDFFCGYSPERINPGDKDHTITKIKKVTSGSTPKIANVVDSLYKEIIDAGTHKAPSIRVAEAAKIIENTQRDLNIALINELSMLFNKMNIDTHAVLDAAGSKWNFLPFKPGLVGGHCIGVDPYYLTHKAKSIGFHSKIILAGRELNDNMGSYVATELIKKMNTKKIQIKGARILVMGLTFKENCPDMRNSGVQSVIEKLKEFECIIDLVDPYADREEVKNIYNIYPSSNYKENIFDAVLITVAHDEFKKIGFAKIKRFCKKNSVIFDIKNIFRNDKVDLRL